MNSKLVLTVVLCSLPFAAGTVILKVADSSDTVSVCKGEKVVFECDAFNSIVQIWNPGPQNVKFGPLDNEKMQNITEDGIIKIKYTLIINKLMKNSTFRHFRSTAQLIAMKNMTMICSNGVGSGTKTKRLQLHIKRVSRPFWKCSPCKFLNQYVCLSWNAPSRGGECCETYSITNPADELYRIFFNEERHMTQMYETKQGKTCKCLPLMRRNKRFIVQCKYKNNILSRSFPIQVKHNDAATIIELFIVIESANVSTVDYRIIGNTTYTEPIRQSNRAVCDPQGKTAIVECNGQTTKAKVRNNWFDQAYCKNVSCNKNFTVTVTVVNEIGKNSTRTTKTLLAAACQVPQEVVGTAVIIVPWVITAILIISLIVIIIISITVIVCRRLRA